MFDEAFPDQLANSLRAGPPKAPKPGPGMFSGMGRAMLTGPVAGAMDTLSALSPVLDAFGFDADMMPVKPMSVEQCVDEGLAALVANRATHITGRMFRILAALTPRSVMTRMNGNMLAKAVARKRARA